DAIRSDGLPFVRDVVWMNMCSLWAQGSATTGLLFTAPEWLRTAAVLLASFFFGTGSAQLLKRAPVVACFMAAYLAVVLIWPVAPARFMWAIWPIVGIAYGLAMQVAWHWWRLAHRKARTSLADGHARAGDVRRWLSAGALASLALMTVGYGVYNARLLTPRQQAVRVQRVVAERARPLAEWVAAATDSTAVISTDDDVLIHLYTGRRTIPNGDFTPQEHVREQSIPFAVQQLRSILKTYKPDYVLASTEYAVYAVRGLVTATPPELRVLGGLKTGGVFAPMDQAGER
ncbi:MAG: hypothetical protein ACT4P7_13725, partial [Gemmatimonadaceae bacterium]